MDFSKEELALIKKAEIKVKQKGYARIFFLTALFVSMVAVLFGVLKHEYFSYWIYFVVLIIIVYMGKPPKYDDLVELLLSKSKGK